MEVDKIYYLDLVKDNKDIKGNFKVLGIQDAIFDEDKEYFLFSKTQGEIYIKQKEIKNIQKGTGKGWDYTSLLDS
jgi:hypothetical protein